VTKGADGLLEAARSRIERVGPAELAAVVEGGGLVVDIRPEAQRRQEGDLPGAVVVERNVLEWRLDPWGDHRLEQVTGPDLRVVVVCSEGYASSLAAAALVDLGLARVADLDGGYQAWLAWRRRSSGDPAGDPSGNTEPGQSG
jgi:rhodanese-related sulfurtransferase